MTMWSHSSRFFAVVCAAVILLGADTGASEETPKPADDPSAAPIDSRIGWIEECLAIKNHTLQPGTPLTIVMFNADEHLIEQRILGLHAPGKILGKTNSREKCPALSEWKGGGNEGEDVSLYTVALDDGPFVNAEDGIFGIGIVGLDPENAERIDLDGNGVADSFSICDSSEGLHYLVWSGAPRQGEPIWRGYYYLGYGLEGPSDCP